LKHSVERFSDLKVGIRELSFLFMQKPTEKQPLGFHSGATTDAASTSTEDSAAQHSWCITYCTWTVSL